MEAQGKEHMVVDVFKLNYITVTTNRIDTTALKKDMPAVAEKYMKATTTKRFTVQ
jgi:predicted phage-related endonuclease